MILKSALKNVSTYDFAPSKDGVNAMNDMYDESARIIIELEKSFSDKKHV